MSKPILAELQADVNWPAYPRRRPIDDLFVIQAILVRDGEDTIDRLIRAHEGAISGITMLAYLEHWGALVDYASAHHIETFRLRDCLEQIRRHVYPSDRQLDPTCGNEQLLGAG